MLFSSVALAVMVAGAAAAEAPVYCGSFTPFAIRVAAEGKSPDARANQAMDVINKYLGGKVGQVATKADGKNYRLLLNGETVAVVTPADASAEKQPSAAALANRWRGALTKAFEESKAQK
jgi:hypothetical protein